MAPAEEITPTPERDVGRPVFTQSWTQLTYLHWPYDPAVVRPFMPLGVEPDVFDGATWVGLIPFAMRKVGVLGVPRLPYVSDFLETNVRLYGVDHLGRRGVVFLSLDADRLLPVAAARVAYRLPYIWSSMTMRQQADVFTYTARRRVSGVRSLLRVRLGAAVQAEPLDHFLTARGATQPVVRQNGLCPGYARALAAAERGAARPRRRARRRQRPSRAGRRTASAALGRSDRAHRPPRQASVTHQPEQTPAQRIGPGQVSTGDVT